MQRQALKPMAEDQHKAVMRLMVKHQGMLSAYLYTMVEDWELVEEALQETAVFMAERYGDFELGTDFGAWARTVARNRCRELIRKSKRWKGNVRLDESLAGIIPEETWAAHGQIDPTRRQALADCVNRLPARQRRVMGMRYDQGLGCSSIAEQLSRSVDAIYMLISRAKQNLKLCIQKRLGAGGQA